MVVGERTETVEEKRNRHIKEMMDDKKGWERELNYAIEKGYREYENYCCFMIEVTDNTLRALKNYEIF